MLRNLRPRGIVHCRALDRLARSVRDLSNIVREIEESEAHLHVVDQGFRIDQSGIVGDLILNVLSACAQFKAGIKGVRFRFGNYQPITCQEITELDKGLLVVTSKRLLFKGNTRNTNLDYSKIIDATIFIDSLK